MLCIPDLTRKKKGKKSYKWKNQTSCHPLNSRDVAKRLEAAQNFEDCLPFTKIVYNLVISQEQVYIKSDLNVTAHGDHKTIAKGRNDCIISENGKKSITVESSMIEFRDKNIALYRENSRVVIGLNSVVSSGFKISFLNVGLSTKFKAKSKRDSGDDVVRIYIGFARVQKNSENTIDGISIPKLHIDGKKFLSEMTVRNPILLADFGNLLSYFSQLLCDMYVSCTMKSERTTINKKYFTCNYWPELDIIFEFIDVNIKKCDRGLLMHFDKMNDWRKGYNKSVVYSYVMEQNDDIYKVTLVMTFRKSIGSLMERVNKH